MSVEDVTPDARRTDGAAMLNTNGKAWNMNFVNVNMIVL